MTSFDQFPPLAPKRQRALSFEEIEEEYQERSKRVPLTFSDEDDSDDSIDSDNSQDGVNDSFSMEEIASRFKIERVLGKGSYGLVVRATDLANNRTVAVKRLRHVFDSSEVTQRVLNEIRLLRALGVHPNVTSLHDVLRDTNASEDTFSTIYMVLEAAHSDLFKILNSTIILNHVQVKSIIHQTLTAISWLHSSNVVHCDVKPANLLIDANCHVQLADFGLSRWSIEKNPTSEENQGSSQTDNTMSKNIAPGTISPLVEHGNVSGKGYRFLKVESMVGDECETVGLVCDQVALECCYRAPEVLWPCSDTEPYRASLDIWSVGCVFAELLRAMEVNEVREETGQSNLDSPKVDLPLDNTGRVLGGHKYRAPLFAVNEVPSWVNIAVSTSSAGSQEVSSQSKSPCSGRRSRSPRPETISHSFSADSRRILGSFIHVLGPSTLASKSSFVKQEGGGIRLDQPIDYLSSGAQLFVLSAISHITPEQDQPESGLECDHTINHDGIALNLLKQMLLFSPHSRPSANSALDHEYFRGLNRPVGPHEAATLPSPCLSRGLLRKELWSEMNGCIN